MASAYLFYEFGKTNDNQWIFYYGATNTMRFDDRDLVNIGNLWLSLLTQRMEGKLQ